MWGPVCHHLIRRGNISLQKKRSEAGSVSLNINSSDVFRHASSESTGHFADITSSFILGRSVLGWEVDGKGDDPLWGQSIANILLYYFIYIQGVNYTSRFFYVYVCFFSRFTSVCMCLCVGMCTPCRGQRATFRNCFSPPILGSRDHTRVSMYAWQALLPAAEPSPWPTLFWNRVSCHLGRPWTHCASKTMTLNFRSICLHHQSVGILRVPHHPQFILC